MKTFLHILFILAILLFYSSIQAKTWRIHNQDPSADFVQLGEAMIDADVVNGDILHVEGSALKYEGTTITKRVHIIGPGYFLNENPYTPANSALALFKSSIIFEAGSGGSSIKGISFIDYNPYPRVSTEVNNILISGCHMPNDIGLRTHITGIIVQGCYIESTNLFANTRNPYYSVSNAIVNNNIFTRGFRNSAGNLIINQFENNVLVGNVDVVASYFRSNILASNTATVKLVSPHCENNLAFNGQFGTENGNQNVDETAVFVGGTSPDGKYRLKPDSPARGAGYDGIDCGIFGGTSPYRLSGLPNIPVIYDLRVATEGDPVNGLQVTIKAKVN